MNNVPFIVRAVTNQCDRVRQIENDIRLVRKTIDEYTRERGAGGADLFLSDMLSIAAAVLEYAPDVILELGRGWGTSTALFRLLELPVISICRTDAWRSHTVNFLRSAKDIDWSGGIRDIVGEIKDIDYSQLLHGKQRILILWDAHGYDVADVVLADILPGLAGKEVLVICHDMRDSRYFRDDRTYKDTSLWRNQEEQLYRAFIRIGNVHSNFDQLVSIVDFTSRNDIPFVSPSHELASNEQTNTLWTDQFWPVVLWQYFELPQDKELTFPRPRHENIKVDDQSKAVA